MAVNMYDRAAEAPIINTYVPIDFNQLYRIGESQRQIVEQASKDLQGTIQTFGSFQSPSQVDTQNYYDQSIGKLKDLVQEAAQNPDAMKDANFRSRLQSRINNLDYTALSNYRQSSENLQQRQKMVAQLQAEGQYNKDWDPVDITNWDTSRSGIMTELAPIKYLTANQLSNSYFDNMKPGALGQVTRNGVRYNRTGNTYEDLESIAKSNFNDLMNTPQGQQYYKQILAQNNGDKEAATKQFTSMIADSQLKRIIRPTEEVDPLWLLQAKAAYARAGQEPKIERAMPTRLDFINSTITKTNTSNFGNLQSQSQYRDYIAGLINKYGANSEIGKNAAKGVKNIDNLMNTANKYADLHQQYAQLYGQTGDQKYIVAAEDARGRAEEANKKVQGLSQRYTLLDEFKKVSGFDAFDKSEGSYSTEGYLKGISRALDKTKGKLNVGADDALLTGIGGKSLNIQDESGAQYNAFQFSNSRGFLLPETVFQAFTKTSPRDIKRQAGLFRDKTFPAKELIESGNLRDIQFIPDGTISRLGNNFLTAGKARIPRDEIEQKLGRSMTAVDKTLGDSQSMVPGTRESTRSSLQRLFGAEKVKEVVGKDGVEYFELSAYRTLPSPEDSPEYWQTVNQRWQNSFATGGLGGATQAKEAYYGSALQNLTQQLWERRR